ncbi:predicted protein [Sclerotinia sclerotiorum 1980 UF-70]|uniref:Uncharacterized protein n=2 Tax=Sclerotinia sclerotiorum (strain ATCC 18683 / 1980 / Ss-1) TaxID=665079 RepID=A0A1D9Q133_SCLS1|nr:predicted protein [Sclerotinia sclerotiorum 1980 UF-70]APA08579.1 hypothetical protein sscle_04g033490 [Sclerotinia sclerotiorum 1980 UF-70]EDN99440.1 predicted protein [Sclerotinia sclerotiorum 1980 UF-70]
MQENDVIAIIIIILFLILALIAYGIYRLVQKARGESTVSGSTESSGSLADD